MNNPFKPGSTCQSIWQQLTEKQHDIANTHLRDLFTDDPDRADKLTIEFADIYIDYSKHRITSEILDLLNSLAIESRLTDAIKDQLSGKCINSTEQRPALHTALRSTADTSINVNGQDITTQIHHELRHVGDFVERLRSGKLKGHSGKSINTLINIGIGGSDLGPRLVIHALKPYSDSSISVRFISNIDATDINQTLHECDPETTLFCVSSKSFTTQETLVNATTARQWLQTHNCKDISKHFIAVTANKAAANEFGIEQDNCFEIWEWVGGRYSLWSSIGLPIATAIGMDNFKELLAGAKDMDEHFSATSLDKNIPVILALLDIWYINFFNTETLAIVPYDESLSLLPDYLSQLMMESNGKHTSHDGDEIRYQTSPIIWGGTGTNAQHAFFQLLHQGTHLAPVEFLVALSSPYENKHHHEILYANCLAQSEALMMGNPDPNNQQTTYKTIPGNKPSTMILYRELNPRTLGALLAMYEHRTTVQGHIWNINSFDQWGVQLGKILSEDITNELRGDVNTASHDASTCKLIKLYKNKK